MAKRDSITITTPAGPILAYRSHIDGLVRARGIPYALAPRFKAPTSYPRFETAYDACEPAAACPQVEDKFTPELLGVELLEGLKVEERDYVALSITLPANAVDRDASQDKGARGGKCPVMVWIHGGGYTTGAGDAHVYDPSRLAREQDIIVVNVTYRLGLFGYIGDGTIRTPNLGLLDQIEALKWVQHNIAAFGGDAQNVTVAGHSSGADGVVHLLACVDEDPSKLCRRAIIQSAPLGIRKGRGPMNKALLEASRDLDEHAMAEQVIQKSKELSVMAKVYGLCGNMPFAPQYGCAPLPEEGLLEATWKRNAAKIDVFIGSCYNECAPFADLVGMGLLTGLPWVGGYIKAKLLRYLTKQVYEDEANRVAHIFAQGQDQSEGMGKVWLYLLKWAPTAHYGCGHAIEMSLLFADPEYWSKAKYLEGAPQSEVDAQSQQLRSLWGSFIRGSDFKDSVNIPNLVSYQKLNVK